MSLSLSPSLRPQCTQAAAGTASPAGPWRRTATRAKPAMLHLISLNESVLARQSVLSPGLCPCLTIRMAQRGGMARPGPRGRVRLRDGDPTRSRTVPDTALAAAVGPDRTANKDQPYQYSKSSLDDSGRAVGGAGLQSRAWSPLCRNIYQNI